MFERETVERWVECLQELLQGMVRDDQQRVSDLPLLNERQREQVLRQFNATETQLERGRCIHQVFEQQVSRTPDAVAVVYDEQSLSYAQLNARANQVARFLRAQGVRPDTLVGLCAERSPEMIIGLLGILKAGGTYLPLDASYPDRRLAYLVASASPLLVLTQEALQGLSGLAPARRLCLDSQWAEIQPHEVVNLDREQTGLEPEHLAYVIYTSGSTGEPKGVMVEHRSLLNYFAREHEFTDPQETDVFLQKLSVGFDFSVTEVLRPLVVGAKLVVAKPARQIDPQYLASLIDRFGVTYATFVPSLLKQMIPYWRARCSSVRRVACGGEPLSAELVRELYEAARADCRVYNLYGPTETTIAVSHYAVPRSGCRSSVPIGKPISNVLFYVLDGNQFPVPVGVAGELYVGGECLARGYLNEPELTQSKFITNPLGEARAPRLYRTGDLVRWLPEGDLEFIGRVDDQVKVRGYRIELGEIESQLREQEEVGDAVVVVREDSADRGVEERRLVAYVTPRTQLVGYGERSEGSTLLSLDALRSHLKERVPPYMIPAAFVILPRLPLTLNGKVDRKALPAPPAEAYRRGEYEPPQGDIEIALAQIWRALLQVEQVGRQDDFLSSVGTRCWPCRWSRGLERYLSVSSLCRQSSRHPHCHLLPIS